MKIAQNFQKFRNPLICSEWLIPKPRHTFWYKYYQLQLAKEGFRLIKKNLP